MAREPIPTLYFTLVVVHLEDRFLLVQERKYEQQWYLPAGRVEKGETLLEAAQRNTIEEAGISVIVEGILRVEHTVMPRGNVRLRVIFVARPEDKTPLDQLSLRGEEVREMFQYMASGAPIYPIDLLSVEGAPFKTYRYRW
ncbi:MAG: NUDIX domain-containing protein [Oscillatoriales cyanobacterium]|nr:MAG: NUDIX domain-containing protein [Oscillatoriales cyanobacterium]